MPKLKKIRMSAAALELQRRYKREWQRAHPDKIREYAARYWEKKAAEEAARAAAEKGDTPEHVKD